MDLPTLTTPATPPYEYSLPDHHHHQDEVSRLNSTSASPKIDQPSSNSYFETTSTMHPPVSPPSMHSPCDPIEPHPRTGFRRVVPLSMPSPPELLHDSEEDDDEGLFTPSMHESRHKHSCSSSSSGSSSAAVMKPKPRASIDHRRKSMPRRSPSVINDPFQVSAVDKSVVFQLNVNVHPSYNVTSETYPDTTSEVICGESLLSALRKRVAAARQQSSHRRRLSAHRPKQMMRSPTRVEIRKSVHYRYPFSDPDSSTSMPRSPTPCSAAIPSHPASASASAPTSAFHVPYTQDGALLNDNHAYSHPPPVSSLERSCDVSRNHTRALRPWMEESEPAAPSFSMPKFSTASRSLQDGAKSDEDEEMAEKPRKKSTTGRRSTTGGHASSGRPSRVKGPCQACQETSDGCMRKAFNWPFPTSTIFNDKGKPFVYLCNKCGLRYNKSGGSVCRHCRWVFCKEEKRKAMQHIEQMRRSRPDGKVDPNEDIENFVCTPKYWTCGRPWKVGWVLNHHGEDDEDDEDMDMHSLSSDTMAVDTA